MVKGQQLFRRITQLKENDYWATLLLGGSLTWGGRAPEGQTHIEKAIQMDPKVPNAYSMLAQNLLAQSKRKEVVKVVEDMMAQNFPTVAENADHAEKIIEALTCVKNVLGSGNALQVLVQKAKDKYPTLHAKLTAL